MTLVYCGSLRLFSTVQSLLPRLQVGNLLTSRWNELTVALAVLGVLPETDKLLANYLDPIMIIVLLLVFFNA